MTKNFSWDCGDDAAETQTAQNYNSTSYINYKPKPERSNIPQLFINRIPLDWQESHLQKIFSTVGRVNYVRVIPCKNGEQAFGFVGYDSLEEGEEAIRQFHDREASLEPYPNLSVQFSKTGGAKSFGAGGGGDRSGSKGGTTGNVKYYSSGAERADEYNAGDRGDKGALVSRRSDTSGFQDGPSPPPEDYPKPQQRFESQTTPNEKKLSCITNKSETKVFYYGSAKNPWEALQNLNLNAQFKQIAPGNYGANDNFANAFQQQTQQQPINIGVNYGQQAANVMSGTTNGPNESSVLLLSPPEYMHRSGGGVNAISAMNGLNQRSAPPTLNVNNCFYCSKPAFFTASCCNQALYCSECCVNSDWTRHRRFCPNSMPEAKNAALMDGLGNKPNQVIDVTNAFQQMSHTDPYSFYKSQIPAITNPAANNIVELQPSSVNEGRFNQGNNVQAKDQDGYGYNRPPQPAYEDNDQRQDNQTYKPAQRGFGSGRPNDERTRDSNRDGGSYEGGRKDNNESFYGASTRPYKSSYGRSYQQDENSQEGDDVGDVGEGPFPLYRDRGSRGGGSDRGGPAKSFRGSRGGGSSGGFRGGNRGGSSSYNNSSRGSNNQDGGDSWGRSGGGNSYNRGGNRYEESATNQGSSNGGASGFDDCSWGQPKSAPANDSFGGGWGDSGQTNGANNTPATNAAKQSRADKYADLKASPEISLINNGVGFEELECGWATTAPTATTPKWGGEDLTETFDDFHGKGKKPASKEDSAWNDQDETISLAQSKQAKIEEGLPKGGEWGQGEEQQQAFSQFVLEQSDKFQASTEFGVIPPAQTEMASPEQNGWNSEEVVQSDNHAQDFAHESNKNDGWNNEATGFTEAPQPEANGWDEPIKTHTDEISQPEVTNEWADNKESSTDFTNVPEPEAANLWDKEEIPADTELKSEAINEWENEKIPDINSEQKYEETLNMWDKEDFQETGFGDSQIINPEPQQTQYATTFENGIYDCLIDVAQPLNIAEVAFVDPNPILSSYKESAEPQDMVLEQSYAHLPSDLPFVLAEPTTSDCCGSSNSCSPYSHFDEIPIPPTASQTNLLIPSKITPSIRTICEYASDEGEDGQDTAELYNNNVAMDPLKPGENAYSLFGESQTSTVQSSAFEDIAAATLNC